MRRFGRIAGLCAAFATYGCAATHEEDIARASPDRPPPDAVHAAAVCGPARFVPGGQTFIGTWLYDAGHAVFVRELQCWNVRAAIGAFWMDEREVSNGCYRQCTERGPCTPPARALDDPNPDPWDAPKRLDLPVSVTNSQARAFCAWRGGRLPTRGEHTRAAQGDAPSLGVPAPTQAQIDCFTGAGDKTLCAEVGQWGTYGMGRPVGAYALDVGPWGHRDLHGNIPEQKIAAWSAAGDWCDAHDGDPELIWTSDGGTGSGALFDFASGIARALAAKDRRFWGNDRDVPDEGIRHFMGFRCAYVP